MRKENATSPYIEERNRIDMEKIKEELDKGFNKLEEDLFSKEEKKILIELICNEQTHMIIKDHTKYESEKYKKLEELKVKIKDM